MDLEALFLRDSDAADALRAGFYRWERANHVPVPVRIWFGPAIDRERPAFLDRGPRWQIAVNGESIESYAAARFREPGEVLERIWPRCATAPIERWEYHYLLATLRYARRHDGFSPFASRSGKVDLLSATIPEPGA